MGDIRKTTPLKANPSIAKHSREYPEINSLLTEELAKGQMRISEKVKITKHSRQGRVLLNSKVRCVFQNPALLSLPESIKR